MVNNHPYGLLLQFLRHLKNIYLPFLYNLWSTSETFFYLCSNWFKLWITGPNWVKLSKIIVRIILQRYYCKMHLLLLISFTVKLYKVIGQYFHSSVFVYSTTRLYQFNYFTIFNNLTTHLMLYLFTIYSFICLFIFKRRYRQKHDRKQLSQVRTH